MAVSPSDREAGVEDYIVRIYRHKEENGGLFGVVEEVGTEGKKPFRNVEELVHLLLRKIPRESGEGRRIRPAVPVTVEGRTSSGTPFSENTLIEEFGPRGVSFRLKTGVVKGSELQLRILPACCELARQGRVARVARGPRPRIVEVVFG